MTRTNCFALIVGCNEYENTKIGNLSSAESDAKNMQNFFMDPARGCIPGNQIIALLSPRLEIIKRSLFELVSRSKKVKESTLFLYFSGHGMALGREGLLIFTKDSDPDQFTFTTLSVREIVSLLAEHNISSSVTILDLCSSGSYVAGAAESALNVLWNGSSTLIDGHYFIGSCGPYESAIEDSTGGIFTCLLLSTIENLAKVKPWDQVLLVESVASAVIAAAREIGISQTPTWTGISISKPISFSLNPHWNKNVRAFPMAVSLDTTEIDDKEKIEAISTLYVTPMLNIGTGINWSSEIVNVLKKIDKLNIAHNARRIFALRLAETLAERVESFGGGSDISQLLEVLITSVVIVASRDELFTNEINGLANRIASLKSKYLSYITAYISKKEWITEKDFSASIAIAPIRFWDVLGLLATIAIALKLVYPRVSNDISSILENTLTQNQNMIRISWAGQYPDISSVLGIIAACNQDLALNTIRIFLKNYVQNALKGFLPAPASFQADRIGLYLASYYTSEIDSNLKRDYTADEGLAFLLFMLSRLEQSRISVNQIVSEYTMIDQLKDYYLYSPFSVIAQFKSNMTECEVYHWVRTSAKSSSKMLDHFDSICMHPFEIIDLGTENIWLQLLASISAGRLFRNRCCYSVFNFLFEYYAKNRD